MKKRVIIEFQFDYDDRENLTDNIIDLQIQYLYAVSNEYDRAKEQRTRSFLDTNEHDINIPFPSESNPRKRARVISWVSMDSEVSDFGCEENYANEIVARTEIAKKTKQQQHIVDLEDVMEAAHLSENNEKCCKSGIYVFNSKKHEIEGDCLHGH
ncbi:MAG: hypothetical protein GY861_28290 [bacterium]|nr:hypothetical protein [bacterium]